MAYSAHGGFPAEYASKIGHMRAIRDPLVQKVVEEFETVDADPNKRRLDFSLQHSALEDPLAQIISVDGSTAIVPNIQRPERQTAFVQIAAQLFKLETLERLVRCYIDF
jgi:hypothetical protein